jgi:FMN phosphatase YigB (HAD superfamily)
MSILERYDVVLLDMGNTFMFDCDRFGDADALARTYAALPGAALAPPRAAAILADLCEHSLRVSRDPRNNEAFPSVMQMLRQMPAAGELDDAEGGRLCEVFARHELGRIPLEHAAAVRSLARTRRLGLISNVWSPGDVFRRALDEAGIRCAFVCTVFSSDAGIIKPSPRIFDLALARFDVPRERVVYVGDSFKRDIAGASAAGIDSVWLTRDPTIPEGLACRPTWIVPNLLSLLREEARHGQ